MQTELENIFLVPFEDKYLLHAPLHGVTSLVNAQLALEIREGLFLGESCGLSKNACELVEPLLNKVPLDLVRSGAFRPPSVSLLTTNDCNLRCLYCAPSAGAGDCSVMSPEICDAALRFQASVVSRENYHALNVYYFGGEPFLAWDLVQYCDRRGRELAGEIGVPFRAMCTTNAVLSEERAKWVAQHLTCAMVSIDGPADIHDFNRPTKTGSGTHENVVGSLRIFESEGLPYVLRCSVDAHSASRLPETVEYFCREFKPIKINIEPLCMEGRCRESPLKIPSPSAFVSAVVKAGQIARRYGVGLKLTSANAEQVAESSCGVTEDNFIVSPDGLVAACFGANFRSSPNVPDYAFGEVDAAAKTVSIDLSRLAHIRTYTVSNIPRCRKCFAKFHCSGGCRLFHSPPFCSAPPNPMCQLTQKLTLWRILNILRLFDEADRVRVEEQEVGYG